MLLSEYARWLDANPCYEVTGPAYCTNLYSLADGIKARNVLEIGTGWGCSTAAFAASLSKREGCRIVTVDNENRIEPKCRRLIRKSGVPVEYVSSLFEDYSCDFVADIIYIDTDWTEESMAACHKKFYGNLRPGGLFILDGMFGQFGPTAFVKNSGLAFQPLQYSESYAHAVHRKEPWPFKPIITYARCYECQWSSDGWDESAIVRQTTEHNDKFNHAVVAGHMQIQPSS